MNGFECGACSPPGDGPKDLAFGLSPAPRNCCEIIQYDGPKNSQKGRPLMTDSEIDAALNATHFGVGWGQVVGDEERLDPCERRESPRRDIHTKFDAPQSEQDISRPEQ
jgi:hypothetical protein